MIRSVAIRCACGAREAFIDAPELPPIGGPVPCDTCNRTATRAVSPLRVIGIIGEYKDPQSGRTFTSNREYNEHLRRGSPIYETTADGREVIVGYNEATYYDASDVDRAIDEADASLSESLKKQGLTVEEYEKVAVEQTRERQEREAAAGSALTQNTAA